MALTAVAQVEIEARVESYLERSGSTDSRGQTLDARHSAMETDKGYGAYGRGLGICRSRILDPR
eukprot:1953077-Rhodomonas_salina.1